MAFTAKGRPVMAFSIQKTFGAVIGATMLAGLSAPASAGTMSVAPLKTVSLNAPVTDVAYRVHHARGVRHVRNVHVRRHYAGRHYAGRHYYYRRHGHAYPAAALGLFAGALGAAIASSSYDNCYYPYYGYGYGCPYAYPTYSYGYAYPNYGYGYAQPRYYYGGRRFHGGYYGHRNFVGPRMGGFHGGPRVAGYW